ncbi:hypothetical protein [Streptomyces sp. NPDC002889]|uniref:hypothetical protein n=1 Tax=Streptomyces sp. NPDC002889 TaxID=3364669 RepID=UPI0036CE396E
MTVLAGCTNSSSGEEGQPAPPTTGPSAKAFDPPLTFGRDVELEREEEEQTRDVGLRGRTAYVLEDTALDAYDTRTGRKLWSVSDPETFDTGATQRTADKESAPLVFVEQGRHTVVLFAFQNTTQGTGTGVSRTSVHLRAVDADTGKVSWTAELPVPAAKDVGISSQAVVGADGETAVVAVRTTSSDPHDDTSTAITYGVDLNTHRVTWEQKDFEAAAVDSGGVVGAQIPDTAEVDSEGWVATDDAPIALVGRSVADGAVRWKDPRELFGLKVERVGGGLFRARVNVEFKEHPADYQLLDVSTGRLPAGMTAGSLAALDGECVHDQRSVVVCAGESVMNAWDTRRHKMLWTLSEDDASRNVPTLLTAWHGAVYAWNDDNAGYVVLDGTTGKDRGTFEGAHVYLVNEYGGLDVGLTAYPATG